MTTSKQKEREKLYAAKVATLLGEVWDISEPEDEINWPDLIVKHLDKRFGVEISEIYLDDSQTNGSPMKEDEAYIQNYISDISKEYYQSDNIPINVQLAGLNRKRGRNKKDIKEEQEIIINALVSSSKTLKELEKTRVEIFRGCVAYIQRLPESFGKYTRWIYTSDNVGWVYTPSASYFEEKIKKKAKKLSKYKRNLEEVSLILVANRIYNSGRMSIENDIQLKENGFKNVYFLSYPDFVSKM